jgi:hypothetical protein
MKIRRIRLREIERLTEFWRFWVTHSVIGDALFHRHFGLFFLDRNSRNFWEVEQRFFFSWRWSATIFFGWNVRRIWFICLSFGSSGDCCVLLERYYIHKLIFKFVNFALCSLWYDIMLLWWYDIMIYEKQCNGNCGCESINLVLLLAPGKVFIKTFFFSLPGEVFLRKKRKKSFYEKFAIVILAWFRSRFIVVALWSHFLLLLYMNLTINLSHYHDIVHRLIDMISLRFYLWPISLIMNAIGSRENCR